MFGTLFRKCRSAQDIVRFVRKGAREGRREGGRERGSEGGREGGREEGGGGEGRGRRREGETETKWKYEHAIRIPTNLARSKPTDSATARAPQLAPVRSRPRRIRRL